MTAIINSDHFRMRELQHLSYQKYAFYGLTIALLFHLSLIATYYLTNSLNGGESITRMPMSWLPPPPSIINRDVVTALNVSVPQAKPTFGVPIPVPDVEISPDKTIATQQEVSQANDSQLRDYFGTGKDIVSQPIEKIENEAEPPIDSFIAVEIRPQVVKQIVPDFPDIARRAGVEGTVWVNCLVDKNGRVKKAIVMKSDNPIFNEPATEAALQWLFTPAIMNNGPVTVWATVPFKFQLNK
ncbi:MAG: TonB family protein [Ignavibacteriae bacterium]|nr:TonB family protein [Ignavibacteriota bacterium]